MSAVCIRRCCAEGCGCRRSPAGPGSGVGSPTALHCAAGRGAPCRLHIVSTGASSGPGSSAVWLTTADVSAGAQCASPCPLWAVCCVCRGVWLWAVCCAEGCGCGPGPLELCCRSATALHGVVRPLIYLHAAAVSPVSCRGVWLWARPCIVKVRCCQRSGGTSAAAGVNSSQQSRQHRAGKGAHANLVLSPLTRWL